MATAEKTNKKEPEIDMIDFINQRIDFLIKFKKVMDRRAEFDTLKPLFEKVEADYDRGVIPVEDKKRQYAYFRKAGDMSQFTKTTLGKIIKRQYAKDMNINDHVLSDFVSRLNAVVWKEPPTIHTYSGPDLIRVYKSMSGTNLSSCMTSSSAADRCLPFYAENPDKVELHCLEDAEEIKARALVWTVGDKKFVDRIYPNSGEYFQEFLATYENKDNVFIRKNHRLPEDQHIKFANHSDPAIIEMKETEHFPYMDTFHYGWKDGESIFITNKKTPKCKRQFSDTGGGFGRINRD